jgi:serine/threonine protein phosphatase PrpC
VVSAYDRLGRRYDAWCRSVTEDIPFYVDLALAAGGRDNISAVVADVAPRHDPTTAW